MKRWEEGRNAKERIALREAEDRERARLTELDRTHPRPGPSRLLEWTRVHYAQPITPQSQRVHSAPVAPPAPTPAGRPPRKRG